MNLSKDPEVTWGDLNRLLPLGEIKVDMAHVRARQRTPAVKQLAKSIRDHGLIHPLGVLPEGGDGFNYQLIWGRDRYAALLLLGEDVAPCILRAVSRDEAAWLKAEENVRRRSDVREDIEAIAKLMGRDKKTGRMSPKGKAREFLAKAKGIKPKSIKEAERRLNRKAEKAERPKPPVVESFGLELDPDLVKRLERIKGLAKKLVQFLESAEVMAKGLDALPDEFLATGKQDVAFRVLNLCRDAVADAKLLIPVALCPYCKGLHDCVMCEGSMFVGSLNNVPPELLAPEPLATWVDNKIEPYEGGF